MKTRVTLIEFHGYREWTESLGYDREWKIQLVQSRLYYEIQRTAASVNAYALPLRYDYMIVLSSSMGYDAHKELFEAASSESPVPVRMYSAVDEEPAAALNKAFKYIRGMEDASFTIEPVGDDEYTAVAHVDINSVTGYTMRYGVLESYRKTMDVLMELIRIGSLHSGVTQYLGGDNILVVFPPSKWREASRKLLFDWVKVGGGRARFARKSMELATRALDMIRQGLSTAVNLLEE